jgi:hypothetical protein
MFNKKISRILLLTCSVGALTSCALVDDWKEGITGERSKEQVLDGPRRVPVNNREIMGSMPKQQPMVQNFAAAKPSAPANVPMMPKSAVDYTAYDRFDDEGNEIAPKPIESSAAEGEVDVASIDSMIDAFKSKPAETTPVGERKSFAGNPNYSKQTEGVAPIPAGPQTEIKPAHEEPMIIEAVPVTNAAPVVLPAPVALNTAPSAPAPMLASSASSEQLLGQASAPVEYEAAKTAPASATATPEWPAQLQPSELEKTPQTEVVSQEEEKPGFFARLGDAIQKPFAKKPEEAAPSAVGDTDYPELSKVPQTPESLKEAKAQKNDKMQQLLDEHSLAQQSKQEIASEPSEFAPVPVAAPEPVSSSTNVISQPTPMVAPAPAPASAAVITQPVTVQPEPVMAQPAAAPSEEIVATPVESAEAPKRNFWDRVNIFKKNGSQQAVQEETPQPQAEPVQEFAAPQSQPMAAEETAAETAAQPLLSEPEPQTIRSATGEELPSLRSAGAPVESVSAISAESAPVGLPSPQSLKTIRLLPSSRYSGRPGSDSQ